MTPPDNSRLVLTYCQDEAGSRFWVVDSYDGEWKEAEVWEYKVLHWQELPDVPEHLK